MKDIKINDSAYFPRPQAMYKELPNYCLHLFYSAENPLPDFTGGTGSI